MKALKYIGLGGLLVLLTIGCSDFLKEYSQDTYYVSSYEDLDELLAGDGYLPVNGCGSNMGYFIHFLADEIEEQNSYYSAWGGGFASGADNFRRNLFGYYTWQQRVGQNDSYTGFITENGTWTELYRLINVMNNVISSIEDVPQVSADERLGAKRVKGEAHFLRAAYYFWLVNLYGKPYDVATAKEDLAVPLKTTESVLDIKFSRNTVQETYGLILSDLKTAEACLAETGEARNIYRADLTAVNLLQSRVHLYMQNWQLAADYADSVLVRQNTLVDLNSRQPYDGFLSEDSEEMIFSMGDNDIPNFFYYEYKSYRVSHELYDAYEEDDLRKTQWWWKRNTFIGSTKLVRGPGMTDDGDPEESDYYNRYYNVTWGGKKAPVSDKFCFRTAEAYLNKAEASAYLGQEDEARKWLNALRAKRYVSGSSFEVIGSGEELVKDIREERRKEFALEGFRWFDLRRYGVCEFYPESKELTHKYTYYADKTTMEEAHLFVLKANDPAYTLPIPQEVLDFNTGMPNNERPVREFSVITPNDN